jgi:hypothetical protein
MAEFAGCEHRRLVFLSFVCALLYIVPMVSYSMNTFQKWMALLGEDDHGGHGFAVRPTSTR